MSVDGRELHLTPTEYELLRVLMQQRGRLMTHRSLLAEVWGPGYEDDTQVLRVHVANLRRKIEAGRHHAADTCSPIRAWAIASPAEPALFTTSLDRRAHLHAPLTAAG